MKRILFISTIICALAQVTAFAQNEVVGTPKGRFSVSPTGAAVYSIEIDAPQGIGGLQPKVEICYNSQAEDGYAGIGCGITGISCISHAPKDIYHDNAAGGISYDANDALYLDGKRLLLTSGTAYTSGATYTVESDPFTVVTIVSSNSGSGISFRVDTPDGLRSYYGATSNSQLNINSTKTHSWYINRAEDARENYISYHYFQDNNCIYPDYIQYGMIDLETGINNKITFVYENRTTDVKHFYIGNVSGSVTKRLKEIRTSTGSNVFRKYVLTYDDQTDGHSRLVSVVEKNATNESMRPITMSWDYLQKDSIIPVQPTIQLIQPSNTLNFEERNFLVTDMNGDGIDDIIQLSLRNVNQSGTIRQTCAFVHFSRYSTNGIYYNNPISLFFDEEYNIDDWTKFSNGRAGVDFDGDGLSDLMIPTTQILNHEGFDGFYIQIAFGKHISNNNLIGASYGHRLYNTSGIPHWLAADFNNDGRTEVFYVEAGKYNGSYKSCYIYFTDSIGGLQPNTIETSLSLDQDPESIQQGDFNGDGLIDIIVFFDDGYRVFFNNGNGATSYPFSMSNSHYGTNLDYARRIYPGDFNGDGAVDFFINEKEAAECYFAFGHNDGTFTKNLACTLDGDLRDKKTGLDNDCFTILVTDFNNDGRSDIVIGKSDYENHGLLHGYSYRYTTYCWKQSTGTTLTEIQRITFGDDRDGPTASHFLLGNFSGIGKEEILGFGRDITGTDSSTDAKLRIYRCGYTPSDGKIVSITDGMGNYTNVNYATIADTIAYTKGTGAQYPVADVQAPFHVVSRVASSRGAMGVENMRYRYGGLKAHLQGKGLLGFSTTQVENLSVGLNTTTTLSDWDSDYFLPLSSTTVTTQAGTTSTAVQHSSLVNYYGNNFKCYADSARITDIYGNQTHRTFEFNLDHGYLLNEFEIDVSTGSYKQVVYSGYQYKGRTYLPTLITRTQKHADDQQEHTGQTRYTYTASGLPSTVIERSGTTLPLTHSYTYDAIGNVLSEAVSATGVQTQTTTYTYNTNRFVSRTLTTPDSTDVRYTYDTFGNRLTMTDHTYGTVLTTQYEYDNWGNLTRSVSPEGIGTTISRGRAGSGGYYEEVQSDGLPTVTSHYDSYGTKGHEESIGPDGVSINKVWNYNIRGALTSEHIYEGSLAQSHTYSYDGLGRKVGETLPSGQSCSYSYGNRSVTKTTAGRNYTTTYDAWGNIKSSTDPKSSVEYTYYSNGKPREVEAGGATWYMEYDEAGNKTLLSDPDAGVTEYNYDAFGRLTSQTDANGYETINAYDEKGRLASTTIDGAVTTYTYGISGNEKKRLIREQNANGYISYTYDTVGRVKTKERNLTGSGSYSFTRYTYNYLNQLVSRTCNNQTEQYYYDSNGYKSGSTINGQDVWQLLDYNGMQTIVQLGDSLTSITERNLQGVTHLALVHGNDTISNFRYEYNTATGNVTSRTGMQSAREDFGYDSLDRLTAVTSSGQTLLQMSYADNGNISSKTGLRNFTYSQTHPHAVEQIGRTPLAYGLVSLATTYNEFNKIESIVQGNTSASFIYGPEQERWKSVLTKGSASRTILYGDDYERITTGDTVRHFYYLDGGAIYVMESGKPDKLLFACTDNLGSIVKLVDDSGASVFNAKYDVWGYQTVTKNQIGFHRGFTGHEMLPDFCLINMNGRMYDPVVGRFLSPDNYVQLGDFSQSYNRYSYCLNNPLKYTDSSGEFWEMIIASALFGAIHSGAMADMNGGNFWDGAWKGALIGAASSASGAYISSLIPSTGAIGGFLSGAAGGAVSGSIAGIGNAWVSGHWHGTFRNIGISAAFGATVGGLIGGINGGFKAKAHGDSFWTGRTRIDDLDIDIDGFWPTFQQETEGLEQTNDFVRDFANEYFPDMNGQYNLFGDGSIPKGYSKGMNGIVYNPAGDQVIASTEYYPFSGKANVYLYPRSFQNRTRLFLEMGHEFRHVYLYKLGISKEFHHLAIWNWQSLQASIWGHDDYGLAYFYKAVTVYDKNFETLIDVYRNFGLNGVSSFQLRYYKPWISPGYIFSR